MNPTQIIPASTVASTFPTTEVTMTSTTAPALTSAQLRAARGVTYEAPISAYVGEVWVDPWAMASADEVVEMHREGALTDAEFDTQLSQALRQERGTQEHRQEDFAPDVIEPVEGALVLDDRLLDLAVELETAALRAETTQPTSAQWTDIEEADFSEVGWSHTMGYSAEMIDRLAVASAHRQAERDEMEALWREQERYDDLDALDFTGVEVAPEIDLSDVEEMMAVAA